MRWIQCVLCGGWRQRNSTLFSRSRSANTRWPMTPVHSGLVACLRHENTCPDASVSSHESSWTLHNRSHGSEDDVSCSGVASVFTRVRLARELLTLRLPAPEPSGSNCCCCWTEDAELEIAAEVAWTRLRRTRAISISDGSLFIIWYAHNKSLNYTNWPYQWKLLSYRERFSSLIQHKQFSNSGA